MKKFSNMVSEFSKKQNIFVFLQSINLSRDFNVKGLSDYSLNIVLCKYPYYEGNPTGILDSKGLNAMMHYTTMTKNGQKYNLEVLYDKSTNTVYHFEYTRKAIGVYLQYLNNF